MKTMDRLFIHPSIRNIVQFYSTDHVASVFDTTFKEEDPHDFALGRVQAVNIYDRTVSVAWLNKPGMLRRVYYPNWLGHPEPGDHAYVLFVKSPTGKTIRSTPIVISFELAKHVSSAVNAKILSVNQYLQTERKVYPYIGPGDKFLQSKDALLQLDKAARLFTKDAQEIFLDSVHGISGLYSPSFYRVGSGIFKVSGAVMRERTGTQRSDGSKLDFLNKDKASGGSFLDFIDASTPALAPVTLDAGFVFETGDFLTPVYISPLDILSYKTLIDTMPSVYHGFGSYTEPLNGMLAQDMFLEEDLFASDTATALSSVLKDSTLDKALLGWVTIPDDASFSNYKIFAITKEGKLVVKMGVKNGRSADIYAPGIFKVVSATKMLFDALTEINFNSGTKGVARLDDKVKSTSAEDSAFWSFWSAFFGVVTGPPINEPGAGSPSAFQAALAAAIISGTPTDLTGKIIEASVKVKAG